MTPSSLIQAKHTHPLFSLILAKFLQGTTRCSDLHIAFRGGCGFQKQDVMAGIFVDFDIDQRRENRYLTGICQDPVNLNIA